MNISAELWSFPFLWYVSNHLCHDRKKWESHFSLGTAETLPLPLSLTLSLTCKQTCTHTRTQPQNPPPCPLCPPLSCAICQGGRESTGGSFILALLTPQSEWCSWIPTDLWVCVCVEWDKKKSPRISLQLYIHRALARVTPSMLTNPWWALSQVEIYWKQQLQIKLSLSCSV